MSRFVLLSVAVVTATGCNSDLWDPAEERALASAEAKWQAAGLHSYTFEYRASCFCDPAVLEWMRIGVVDGVVAEVVYAVSTDVSPPVLDAWPAVEELFARIHRLRDGESSHTREVDIDFDPTLGYPTLIRVAMDRDIVDGGATYYTRRLTPDL